MIYNKQQKENGKRGLCPVCQSRELQMGNTLQETDKTIFQEVTCLDCNDRFHQIYKIIKIEKR